MKKTILHIGMLAAAALAFFSCVKETESPYKGRTHSVTVTVEKMLDSKTAIVEGTTEASYVWTEDDANYFHIYENGVEPLTKTMSLSQDHKYATFNLTFGENNSSSYEYTARYFSEEASTKNPKILAAQSPKLDSFDPAADLLIASPKTLSDHASNIQFSLSRVVSVNKMTLKELEAGEVIQSVEIGSDKSFVGSYIIFHENQPVDGHHNLDAKKITLTYPAAVNAVVPSNGEFPVYFTCGPVEGAKLSIRVVTDKNVYERDDFTSTVDFQVGVVKRFGVKLGNYGTPVVTGTPYVLVETQADLIDGATYIIVGNNTDLVAMAGQNNNNRGYVAVTAENNIITIDNTIAAATFTIESVTGGYSIKDNSNNLYLYAAGANSSNYLRSKDSVDETATWSITIDSGIASIVTAGATRGTMCFNSTNSIFSCYANLGSYKTLSLYVDQSSIVPDTRTPVTLSFSPANPADLTLGDTFSEPTLTVDPSEAPIAYTVETVPANIATINASTGKLNITAAGTITVTASVSDETNYKPASASYSLTVVDPNVVDYVTLPWAYPEGNASATSAGIKAITGVTAEGLGSDYAAGNAPYLIKLDGTGDYFQIKTDSAIGQVSVKYKMIGGNSTSSLTFSESSDGNTWTEVQSLSISGDQNSTGVLTTSNAFDSNSRYVKIVFTKGSNVGIGGISITDATSASITWNLESIAITTPPTKTVYTEGESFNPTGMVVTGHFVDADDNTNEKDEAVTGYTISPDGALATTDDHVTITYQGKTANQSITVNAAPVLGNDGSLDHPFTVSEVRAYMDASESNRGPVYITGIVSSVYAAFDQSHGTGIFYISDDGETTSDQFEAYSVKFLGNNAWVNGNTQIAVGNTVIVYGGELTIYNSSVYETKSGSGSYLYSLNGITSETVPTITVSDITGVAAAGVSGATTTVTFANNDGWSASVAGDGTIVTSASISGSTITYSVAANSSDARTGSITVTLTKSGRTDVVATINVGQLAGNGNTTITETITSGTFSGDTNSISLTTSSGITITQLKNGSTNVNTGYNTVSTLRVYRANQMQFTGKTFTKIEMYYTGNYSGADWSVVAGGGTVTIDTTNKKVVWTNTSGASTVTLQNSTSSGTNTQLRTTKFYFEY